MPLNYDPGIWFRRENDELPTTRHRGRRCRYPAVAINTSGSADRRSGLAALAHGMRPATGFHSAPDAGMGRLAIGRHRPPTPGRRDQRPPIGARLRTAGSFRPAGTTRSRRLSYSETIRRCMCATDGSDVASALTRSCSARRRKYAQSSSLFIMSPKSALGRDTRYREVPDHYNALYSKRPLD